MPETRKHLDRLTVISQAHQLIHEHFYARKSPEEVLASLISYATRNPIRTTPTTE